MCMCMCVCMYVCMYIYIYKYIYMHKQATRMRRVSAPSQAPILGENKWIKQNTLYRGANALRAPKGF